MLNKHRINILSSQIKESVDKYFTNEDVVKSTFSMKSVCLQARQVEVQCSVFIIRVREST